MPPQSLSQTIPLYLEAKRAQRLSPCTLLDYERTYTKLRGYLPTDPLLSDITLPHLRGFLNSQNCSRKTLFNIHVALSSLWTWAVLEELCPENIVKRIPRAKPEKRQIQPITRSEMRALIETLGQSLPYARPGQHQCANTLPGAQRDYAIFLTLLDTGARASEIAGMRLGDVTPEGILVFGKGAKERIVPISLDTRQCLRDYLATRPTAKSSDPLFATLRGGTPLDRHDIRKLVERNGKRAGVSHLHPHRFRHTMAIEFLRNGGDPFSLQLILGHSTMDMVKVYLAIAQSDLAAAHRKASPVKCWGITDWRHPGANSEN